MLVSLIYFAAGIGVFIWGIITLTKGLNIFSQRKITHFIKTFAGSLPKSIIIGFFITLIIQSSSMISVIAVTMAGAKLLNLKSAAGIIIGSNIGTTIAVQLYAFNLFKIAPYAVFVGSILYFQNYNIKLKFAGNIILGFGLIFYGLKIMELAAVPLKKFSNFNLLSNNISNPFWGIFIGIITALIMQSSNIGIATLQILTASHLITLSTALPIIYGLNIGTCSEAIILSLASNKEGKKIALFNIFFNIIGAIVFLPLTDYFAEFLKFLSPNNAARQVANAHTFFNLFSAILIIPFLPQVFFMIERIVVSC